PLLRDDAAGDDCVELCRLLPHPRHGRPVGRLGDRACFHAEPVGEHVWQHAVFGSTSQRGQPILQPSALCFWVVPAELRLDQCNLEGTHTAKIRRWRPPRQWSLKYTVDQTDEPVSRARGCAPTRHVYLYEQQLVP